MQAVVKKVVYSFRYRLGPGQVGREVFYIVLIEPIFAYMVIDIYIIMLIVTIHVVTVQSSYNIEV